MIRPGSTPPADAEIVSYSDPKSVPVPLRSSGHSPSYPPPPDVLPVRYYDQSGILRTTDRSFTEMVEKAVAKQVEADRNRDEKPVAFTPRDARLGPDIDLRSKAPAYGSPDEVRMAYSAACSKEVERRENRKHLVKAIEQYDGHIFPQARPEPTEVERYFADTQRRVDEIMGENPTYMVEDALREIYREREREAKAAPAPTSSPAAPGWQPLPAPQGVERYSADRLTAVRRRISSLESAIVALSRSNPAGAAKMAAEKRALVERYGSHLSGKDRSADPGVLLAVWIPPEIARELAIKGGVPADQMHVTLCYLGRKSDFTDWELDGIAEAASEAAAECPPMEYLISGNSHFAASESSDGKDVAYAAVEGDGLIAFRQTLVSRLADAGFSVDGRHGSYTPHVTLAYVPPGDRSRTISAPPRKVPMREIVLAIGDERKTFKLGTKTAKYSATVDRARQVLAGIARERGRAPLPFDRSAEHYRLPDSTEQFWSSVTKALPHFRHDENWKNFKPSLNPGSVRVPGPPRPSGGRTLVGAIGRILAKGRQVAGQLDDGGDRMAAARRGIVAEIARRRGQRNPVGPGTDGMPPSADTATVPTPRTPPSGSGPARAEAVAPTSASARKPAASARPAAPPARDPASLVSQMRPDVTTDHTWSDINDPPKKPAASTPPPAPSATVAPVRPAAGNPLPAGLPSQARPDRTSDVSEPRPALANNPAPTLDDLPETQPAGVLTPGQSTRGTIARQNNVSPSAQASRQNAAAVLAPQNSIGGREDRSGLQPLPGSAGLKSVTTTRPAVSAMPRQARSQEDRARDGGRSTI